ncbi:MAG: GNAT family N-acetyltransferase [Candidatus Jordarchaeaceae archaeon]
MLEIRGYKEGDEEHILRLFKASFKKDLPIELWRWRYKSNPLGTSIIMLMFDDDLLVGHYGVTLTHVLINGDKKRAALSMTTMTHPYYRGRGIFVDLAKRTYSKCEEEGVELVYGFPNENIYNARVKKLDWVGFGRVSAWFVDLRKYINNYNFHHLNKFFISKIKIFRNDMDVLWEQAMARCRFIVPRTAKYLNWRYIEKPGREYHPVAFYGPNGDLDGYAVYKIYHDNNEARGHIIDLLFKEGNDIPEAIIDYGLKYFMENNITSISCWIPEACGMENILQRKKFFRYEWPCYFGIRYLGTYSGVQSILSWKDLYITMGDSDVF